MRQETPLARGGGDCFQQGASIARLICEAKMLIKVAEAKVALAPGRALMSTAFRQTIENAEDLVRVSGTCLRTDLKDHAIRELEEADHFFQTKQYLSADDALNDVI